LSGAPRAARTPTRCRIMRCVGNDVRDRDPKNAHPDDEHDSEWGRHELVAVAAMLSFVIPGLGHLVIAAWLRGSIWWVGWLVVSAAGGGGVNPIVVALMFIAGLDALLYGRARDD
jgi:hypothetical protein